MIDLNQDRGRAHERAPTGSTPRRSVFGYVRVQRFAARHVTTRRRNLDGT